MKTHNATVLAAIGMMALSIILAHLGIYLIGFMLFLSGYTLTYMTYYFEHEFEDDMPIFVDIQEIVGKTLLPVITSIVIALVIVHGFDVEGAAALSTASICVTCGDDCNDSGNGQSDCCDSGITTDDHTTNTQGTGS